MSLKIFDEWTDGDETKLVECFDNVMKEMPENNDEEYLKKVLHQLEEKNVNCVGVMNHFFFTHLRNRFVHTLEESNGNDEFPYRISEFFSQQMIFIDEKNSPILRRLFAEKNLIECLIKYLRTLSPNSSDFFIHSIGNMINFSRKFQEDHPDIQDDSILSMLIMPIVDFVKKNEYEKCFLQLTIEQMELSSFENLILIICPKYITAYRGQLQEEIVSAMVQEILNRSAMILKRFLPLIDRWTQPIIYSSSQLILLCQRCANQHLLSSYDVQHEKILDEIIQIVQNEHLNSMINENSTLKDEELKRVNDLLCYSTLYIYTMTFLTVFREKLKEYPITPILIKLTQIKYEKTQFHAYRALAAVLTDNDIKQLANPSQITNVFLIYMKKFIDQIAQRQRLENLLLSLKILTQHDQIREALVKHVDGLSLLLRCAMESQFDQTKIQLRSLKILMSLTFIDQVKKSLGTNEHFLNHLRKLVSSSGNPKFQNIADGILWRLTSKNDSVESKFQYDIMISYAHKDKDLCHRIHKSLVADRFRVWIDLERMNGIIMEAIAEAIEQSRYVMICMSDSYSISPYCQSEAHYAFEKRRVLVPIKVQTAYKPQGWLAMTISGRMYVDFIKMNFETAYSQLLSQLRQHRVDGNDGSKKPLSIKPKTTPIERTQSVVYSYPKNIYEWNSTNVKDFLMDKQLDEMIPLCESMDGKRLVDLYKLCRSNSALMLQNLRLETKDLHGTPLSTNTYLKFLNEIISYQPESETENKTVNPQSNVCTLI